MVGCGLDGKNWCECCGGVEGQKEAEVGEERDDSESAYETTDDDDERDGTCELTESDRSES